MRTASQSHYLRRLSLWVLGQALPDTGALREPARLALTGVVVAAAAGTLLALSVVAGLIGLYVYLTGEGLSAGASLSVVASLGVMASVIAFLLARRRIDAVPDALNELQLFSGRPTDLLGELLQMAVGGFMEGIAQKPEAAERTADADRTRAGIEEAIEALVDRLDAMEEEAEVVLAMDQPRRRRKPH